MFLRSLQESLTPLTIIGFVNLRFLHYFTVW